MARKHTQDSEKDRNGSASDRFLPKSDPALVNYGEGVVVHQSSRTGRFVSIRTTLKDLLPRRRKK